MNERIKELAEQAGMGPWGIGNGDNVSEIAGKFAELIVQECADLFTDKPESMTRYTGPACREMIKQYFRVKE